MSGDAKLLDGYSPVNKYELLSLEQSGWGLTENRMILAFQAMDELIPKLGVYTRVFLKLRDDLFRAIYSEELTSVKDKCTESAYIQRIPYFVLVRRIQHERNEKSEQLKEQLDVVKERLFSKHKQFEQGEEQVVTLQTTVDDLTGNIADLDHTVAEKNIEIVSLDKELETTHTRASMIQDQLEAEIRHLQESLLECHKETDFLTKFKKGYDDLYDAFLDKPEDDDEDPKIKKKAVISTKRANLISEIECCSKLENQVLSVINISMEEYDEFLEEHKQELESKVTTEEMTEAELDIQEMEIDDADQQLEIVQDRFSLTIGEMMTELGLLRQHNTMLMEQLQTLEENRPAHPKKKEIKQSKDNLELGNKRDSILSAGLGQDEVDEDMSDPFIPQERVFSKYAAMIYTSNNSARTFEEFKEAKYCASCGEKTVICPHRLGGSERVFILPHNCTHLKVTRPKVRINTDLIDGIMRPTTVDTYSYALPPDTDVNPESIATPTGILTPGVTVSRGSTSMTGGETNMTNMMQAVWDDFQQRTQITRAVARPLDMQRTLSMMEQFLAYLVWKDDYGEPEEGYFSILDNLYLYLTERYLVEEVVYLAAHDLLTAITDYSTSNKMLQLLGTVLSGNLDASCLRYVLLLSDFINSVHWRQVEDFRAFSSAVYPFLGEDDLETLQMSYQSYSENKVSTTVVTNFIIHIILKYREPRFLELENNLVPFQTTEGGHLTEKEFKDALENLLPLVNDKLQHRLFMEAEHTVLEEDNSMAVPIMRLAQISGYLSLCQLSPIIKDNVLIQVASWRDRPTSAASANQQEAGPTAAKQQSIAAKPPADSTKGDNVLCMNTVKNLASNVSRRAKHRQTRLLVDEGMEDW